MSTIALHRAALPRLPRQHLPRERLHASLSAAECRLRLLVAPPGCGKTVLMSECARLAPVGIRVVWLGLGGRSLEPAQFCERLGEALGVPWAGEDALCAWLETASEPTWLMLDDYPRAPDAALDDCFDRLLAVASPQIGWWLASRRRPLCNLTRLLLEGELLEVGAANLALTQYELDRYLQADGLEWPQAQRESLHDSTQGWFAGVRLRLLSMGSDGLAPCATQLAETGGALLQDYLQREVLATLPAALAETLCALAYIPRFNRELSDYLFDEPGQGLDGLLGWGALIEPVDNTQHWFRVAPMVAPALASLSRWPAATLHRRACQWFTQGGEIHSAFEHSLLADEPDVSASLLQGFTEEQLLHGCNVDRVLRLREMMPAELLCSTPRLLILNAWTLLFVGRLDDVEALLAGFTRFLPMPGARRQRALIAQWQGLNGVLNHARGRMGAGEQLREALEHLPEDAWAQTLICLSALTQQAQADGRLAEARLINRDALKLARLHGSLTFEALLELDRAQWLEQRGELQRADALLARVQEYLDETRVAGNAMAGRVALRRGWLCLRQGRDEEARELFISGLIETRRSHDPSLIYGFTGLAWLDALDGDTEGAFNRLIEVERLMQLQHVPEPMYRGPLLLASGALNLRQGRPGPAREVLQRVAARYRIDRLTPPAAAPDQILQVEHHLALAELYDGEVEGARQRLQAMLPDLLRQGRHTLACDVWLALAETHYIGGNLDEARQALDDGVALAQRFGLLATLRETQRRQPALFGLRPGTGEVPAHNLLSLRELSVLELIARGCSNLEIGERLYISLHTVKTHARRINGKLGVERRTQAVARAKELGLLKI
ncbi:LuxR C-terminal-related transcriptional regulator [Pseudomonas sp. ZM23]|uniref:LuxR C-terminal-related transcriptional regulator n=1 Tax=Pseudomonas triclosanedens TaxID=2961893 RepID=A0ABY6ZUW6_9PSED|nr:LuxR C-terminal-related transcriptional regulator [Pseudomonas triclosanedens]MCP8463248.1 LuxR C-terminal-related transcriptional regulator [Pseudomonas triclosanedens]MCP8469693.1 LuxR C-terminal-related transcriptional regulator [Pseudomonas triclosanedens]MCP8474049.1 LuxR C-terminal-related transcriptional regulator [Pseudomonas triclosanedens]WAI48553.1 LuxR C-terminal-related transcriptional regulator [Pseudomonas triclosanedens]